jgi:hypothetical protein
MRRTGRVGIVTIAALLAVGSLGLPTAGAAPVAYSPTPLAGWSTNGPVYAVLIVGDTVYAGGNFTQVRGPGGTPTLARSDLAAFDIHTGAVRTGFAADTNGTVRALATDGSRLFVGGSFTTIKGVSRGRVAALDLASGAVNAGFLANTNSNVYALRVQQTRLYVGGSFSTIGTATRSRIAAVSTTNGAVDATFNPNANDAVHAIVVSPDGTRVYAGGDFATIGGGSRRYIASLSSTTGALQAPVFQYSTYGPVLDLDISPTGDRVYAALGGTENQVIAWNTGNGTRAWFYEVDGDTQAVRVFDGNVYFGFHEGAIGDATVRMLVADAASGALVNTYRLPINSFYGVWDIDASSAALVLGGEFTRVNQTSVQGVAILPSGGGVSSSSTLVPAGSSWRYLDNGSNQGTAWRARTFADTAWKQGNAQLGYGDGDEATVVSFGPNANQKYVTTYFRRQFTVDPSTLATVTLQLKRDDGAVVYLNGTEIVRSNMPTGAISSTTLALDAGSTENQFFSYTVPTASLVNGSNTLAVEVHQTSATSSDVSFDLSLAATRR